MTNHLYDTFNLKYSGDLMRYWIDKNNIFHYTIWSRLEINHDGNEANIYVNTTPGNSNSDLHIPFTSFIQTIPDFTILQLQET